MENSPSLLNPLTSPALMVMASAAADSSRGPTASPCQQQFGVPVTVENSVPFLGASYSLAAMYHHSERLSGAREFHSSHLLPFPHPPTFGHPGLGGYGTLRPFHPTHMPFPDEVERFSNAYAAAVAAANASVSGSNVKLSKLPSSEPPQIRYLTLEKETGSATSGMVDKRRASPLSASGSVACPIGQFESFISSGKIIRTASGHLRRTPSPLTSSSNKKEKRSEVLLNLQCPLCHTELTRAELRDHLQCEIERLTQFSPSLLHLEGPPESSLSATNQSPSTFSLARRDHERESPAGSPLSGEEGHKLDRRQVYLQVKSNREGRLGARAGRCKRLRATDDDQLEAHTLKGPRPPESEEDSMEDFEYRSPAQSSPAALLHVKDGRLGTPHSVDSRDSELEIDSEPEFGARVSHDDSLIKVRTSPPETQSSEPQETRLFKWRNDGLPSGSEAETAENLKAQISELTAMLKQKETYRCHVCLGLYNTPVASIQCWHIHCEDCWLRSLGSKKLCPQCSTITSPGDLRRVYL
ncbi:E3 ubiquitin-protein ligase RNF220-like isoform X2 [Polypterus senegalus]|uniref:E3 ubiquitin-protein ligase RNF220-like isoform X2 n=1 Tax=Polypterus senegalus TaxID=55291 RepID=UPI00196694A8|nr:E3 ubiquitin-protein ligase RNF220-like isoform X2 [Polypterus senegalus]